MSDGTQYITLNNLIKESSVGIIYIRTEDNTSVIRRLVSQELGELCPEWSIIGIYYIQNGQSHQCVLFDYWSGNSPITIKTNVLSEIVKSPLVSKITVRVLNITPDDEVTLRMMLLKDVLEANNSAVTHGGHSSNSAQTSYGCNGKNKIDSIFNEAKIVQDGKYYQLKIDNAANAFFETRDNIASGTHNNLIDQLLTPNLIYKLLACEEKLLTFITKDSPELQRLLMLINTYRSYFHVSPLSYTSPKDIAKEPIVKSQETTLQKTTPDYCIMDIIKLRKMIHYISSLGDKSLDGLERYLMRELALRSNVKK